MNEELEVRESSLSYVIITQHGNRRIMIRAGRGMDDKVWYSAVCYGAKTEMRGHVHRRVVREHQRRAARADGTLILSRNLYRTGNEPER